MSRHSLLLLFICVLLCTIHIFSQVTPPPAAEQPNDPSKPNPNSRLKRLSTTLDSSRMVQPAQWPEVFQHLLSFQKLSLLHRFGPYGQERADAEMLAKIEQELPELKQIYTNPDLFVDFHNYLLPAAQPIPPHLLQNTTISHISTNIPFAKINEIIKEQQQHTAPILTDIAKLDPTTATTAPALNYTKHTELIYTKQHEVYSLIHEHFPTSPYLRLEITGEHDDLLRAWFETYTEAHGVEYILLQFSSFFRQIGHGQSRQKQTVLYIEPDIVIHHGAHYQRLSQHGQNTAILMVLIFALIIGSQLGFQYWQQTHQSTYDIFIVFCLWLVPLGVALWDHFRRFIIIWWLYTATTIIVLSLLLIDLNPLLNKFLHALSLVDSDSASTTSPSSTSPPSHEPNASPQHYIIPQRYIFSIVYKYFLILHKLIIILLVISVAVFFLDIFGVFQALGLEPHMVGELFKGHQATAEEVLTFVMFALYGCFYSLYFGVLNRDIATIVIPQLTILSTRFKLNREAKKLETDAQRNKASSQVDHISSTAGSKAVELTSLTDPDHQVKQRGHHGGAPARGDDQSWNSTNLGSILGDDSTQGPTPSGDEMQSFFSHPDSVLDQTEDPESRSLLTTGAAATTTATTTTSFATPSVSRGNSCGICHELLKSQQTNAETPRTASSTTTDLPTIQEIRERLRQRSLYPQQASSNTKVVELAKRAQQALINGFIFVVTNIVLLIIEYSDKFTGGTGEVNLDNVTVVEGMYTINNDAGFTSSLQQRRANDYQGDTSVLDQEDDHDGLHFLSTGYAGRTNLFTNTMTTNNDVVFQLPCGCYCHDICLRGFMLLGKHNICPGCRELSNLDVFVSPWDSVYDNYRNFLDSVKYCIAVNPLLLFVINLLIYFFW